jgi:hypothetical protein
VVILDEFRRRIAPLHTASADDITGRLGALLQWLEEQLETRLILQNLKAAVDEKKIFEPVLRRRGRPTAYTPDEIGMVGLVVMENCRDRPSDFLQICIHLGLAPTNTKVMVAEGLQVRFSFLSID